MAARKPSRVIIDTNLWVSFLIGKELQILKNLIVHERVKIIMTDQLIDELRIVTARKKIKKYFPEDKVHELITLLSIISESVTIDKIEPVCRDSKDDFLLTLSKEGKADYLITGDKDLLAMKVWGNTEIVSVKSFREKVE